MPAFVLATLLAVAGWWAAGRAVAIVDAPSERVPCLSYAPYRDGQTPFEEDLVIPPEQIAHDLKALSGFTDCVRTYATEQGLAEVPRLAETLGLKVMLGAWIGSKPEKNEKEIARAIELANRYPETIRAVIVGNEVLLRREQPAERLSAMIREVKAAVPVPVTYADVWEFWEKHPEVSAAVDFVTIHTLPYWEDEPTSIEEAIDHVATTWKRIQDMFPGKAIFIGEAGWPSAGRAREGALPSRINQARFVRELLARGQKDGIGINLIEAFDQPWKRKLEGTVGGHWGLFDADRRAKFPLQGPVAADPGWKGKFAGATAIAGLAVLLIAWVRRMSPLGWLLTAIAAHAAGATLVIAFGQLLESSRTLFHWAIGLLQLDLVLTVAILAAIVLLRGHQAGAPFVAAAPILQALADRRLPPHSTVAGALGVVRLAILIAAAATTLALVFDPRYRDFPVALYGLAAVSLAALISLQPPVGGNQREERFLGLLLAAGAIAIFVNEGLQNGQALAWAATALALAAHLLQDLAPTRLRL